MALILVIIVVIIPLIIEIIKLDWLECIPVSSINRDIYHIQEVNDISSEYGVYYSKKIQDATVVFRRIVIPYSLLNSDPNEVAMIICEGTHKIKTFYSLRKSIRYIILSPIIILLLFVHKKSGESLVKYVATIALKIFFGCNVQSKIIEKITKYLV